MPAINVSADIHALLQAASDAAARTELGLGTAAVEAAGAFVAVAGLGTGVATFLATPSSANLAAAVTGETGSGALVFATSPSLVTPLLGTPTSGTLTNCTGLPAAGVVGTALVASDIGTTVQAFDADLTTWAGITPGAGVATFLATPSSANLAAAVTGETGSGALVFATSPVLVTPALGTPTSGVLSSCTGYPGTAVTSVGEVGGTKFLREDGDGTCSWQTVAGGGDALVANPLSQFAATTSAQLRGVISDEAGTGVALFAGADVANMGFNVVLDSTGTVALVNGTHKNKILVCNNATATTVTVEDDTTGSWSDAAEVLILQNTANGTVTVVSDGTASVNGSTAFTTTTGGQYEVVALKRIGANAWICTGGTASVTAAEIEPGIIDYALAFVVDSDVAITTGAKHRKRAPVTGNIVAWYLATDTSATITIDVWKHASAEPTNTESITNANEPTVAAGQFASDVDLSNWTSVAVTAGDIIKINVDANDNATYFELVLVIRPT